METDGFRWNVVILDTAELDEDFPLGIVILVQERQMNFMQRLPENI